MKMTDEQRESFKVITKDYLEKTIFNLKHANHLLCNLSRSYEEMEESNKLMKTIEKLEEIIKTRTKPIKLE